MLYIQSEDRFVNGLARGDQTAAKKAAAGEHGEAWTQRDIGMVTGPDFIDDAILTGDFLHFITRHPDTALAYKLAL